MATIGYTLAAAHHGRAMPARRSPRWSTGCSRLTDHPSRQATVDPQNTASIRLLEGLGFVPEGLAPEAAWSAASGSTTPATACCARTRSLARPPSTPPDTVRLVPITADNVRPVAGWPRSAGSSASCRRTSWSLAEAYAPGDDEAGGRLVPWVRAIEADGEPVGFVMLAEPTATQAHPFLWRLMIDRHHQRRGIGQLALWLVIEQAVAWNATQLEVGWMPGIGSPAPFYLRTGSSPTGEVVDEEIFARLTLASSGPATR